MKQGKSGQDKLWKCWKLLQLTWERNMNYQEKRL